MKGPVMREKLKEPPVPLEMHETLRRMMSSALEQGPRSAKELSAGMRIPEKEVYVHLEHIRVTVGQSGRHLLVTPAKCKKCGFVFSKRERLKKPGRCPVCRGESIHGPLFSIEQRG